MIIRFSHEQELNIERTYSELKESEIKTKKRNLLNNYCRLIEKYMGTMKLIDMFDEIVIDFPPSSTVCFFMREDRKKIRLYFDNLEDERDSSQIIIHQLGHVQDIFLRKFDIDAFNELSKPDPAFAYLLWDICLDGRLSAEKYYTYFQMQGFYYEYKMKLRSMAKKEEDSVDSVFDKMWNKKDYSFEDVRSAFNKFT